jgi:hypothetical protein
MMILTDYYRFEKLPDQKSKLRIDCTTSTKSYPEFEMLRNKTRQLFVYFGDVPDRFGGNVHRKADKAITKVQNISSVYVPDVTRLAAFGDIRGTTDALLILFNDNYTRFDLFIARGQKNNVRQLYNLLIDGELLEEIEYLKKQAVTDLVTMFTV